jgi:hypothetical protein
MGWWQQLIVSIVAIAFGAVLGYWFNRRGVISERSATEQKQLRDAISSIFEEVRANGEIANRPWTGKQLPFLTDMWNTYKGQISKLQEDVRRPLHEFYIDVIRANSIVNLDLHKLPYNAGYLDDDYRKMCSQIANQVASVAGLLNDWLKTPHTDPLRSRRLGRNIMENKDLQQFVTLIIGSLTGFTYLLYFVGRTYTEAFSMAGGIALDTTKLHPDDYMYAGAHPDTLVITLVFTSIFVGFLWYLFRDDKPRYRRGDLVIGLSFFLYYGFMLAAVTMWVLFDPTQAVKPPMILGMLASSMAASGCSLLILFDRGLAARIKGGKVISKFFFAAIVITLVCFPYIASMSWGAFKVIVTP